MAEQIRKSKTTPAKQETVEEVEPTKADAALKDELDDLLDEIDSVLEVNAEEFVKNYIQKGGQLCRTFWETLKAGVNVTRLPRLFKV